MNYFNIFFYNFIFISCPLLFYLFYIAYNKKIDKKTNFLILNFVLLTMLYLLVKFDELNYRNFFLTISIIPLIIAYVKKDYVSIILVSIVEILYINYLFEFNIWLLLMEYILFFFLSLFVDIKNIPCILILVRTLSSILFIQHSMLDIILMGVGTFIIYSFISLLIKNGEKLFMYHLSLKDLEKEKQVRNSLFKISHEIKNPLAVCKGYFDMLDINNSEQVTNYLPIIKDEIDHALVILQDFLSMTKVKVDKDDMDINMLVEEVADSFKPIFKNKRINTKVNLLDEDVYIQGDYNRLKQVLINILKNSVEAIDKENGSISINTAMENNNFEIIIKDNGNGMSNEVISHLAEPFYTTKRNGTGLGIALSKEILKQHGANLEYYSNINIGTTALIKIPIEKNA